MSSAAAAAIDLARKGFAVFPCKPRDKVPATEHGCKDASNDPAAVETLFANRHDCNIGIATGPASGAWVLDVEAAGIQDLHRLEEEHGELSPTVLSATGGGGRHYFFRCNGVAIRNRAKIKGMKIDVRGDGGYVVCPPSIHNSGSRYQWINAPGDFGIVEAPAWLVDLVIGESTPAKADFYGEDSVLERARKYVAKCPPAIQGQNGSGAAFHVACVLVLGFGLSRETALVLMREWSEICQPPWGARELEHKVNDAAKQSGTRNYLRNVAPQNWPNVEMPSYRQTPKTEQSEPEPISFKWITSAELDALEDEDTYLVEDVWPAEQGGIISGRFKTLKTGVAVDLAMSAACGVDFLARFRVPEPVRVGIMSAESGTKALQRRGRTVAASMDKTLSECRNLVWSTASPRLARIDHLDALRKAIVVNEFRGVIIDPTYLALCDIGPVAGNVFSMGAVLNPLTEIIRETRCSIVLVNHNVKGRSKDLARFDPPDLGEISMSGFAEWARFWLLLGQRKEWNEDAGEHWLWLRTGGSAGHAGLWHVDATEGPYISDGPKCDRGRRRWLVSVVSASEGSRDEQEAKRAAKAETERTQLGDDKRAIVQAFDHYPDGESKRFIRDCLSWGDKRFNPPFGELLREGLLVETQFKKSGKGKSIDGYRIKRDSEN